MLRNKELKSDIKTGVLAYLVSRAVLTMCGWIALSFIAQNDKSANINQIVNLACRWDCGWYMTIAEHGYSTATSAMQPGASNLAFWPAFPFAARFLSTMSGMSILVSGVILANVAFAICLVLFKRYCTSAGLKESGAIFATFLMAFSPQSFVFSTFYGDAFGLLGVVGSMYFSRTERWWLSGAFAILATLSRPTGAILLVFLLLHAYENVGWQGLMRPWLNSRPFIPVVLLPLGELLVFLISYNVSGDAFAQSHSRIVGWHATFEAPWTAIVANIKQGPTFAFWEVSALILSLSIIPILRYRLIPEAAYTFLSFMLIFSGTEANSLLRYAVAIPTVFLGAAIVLGKNSTWRHAALGISSSLGAAIFLAWTLGSWISI